jgi:hypothetical protein
MAPSADIERYNEPRISQADLDRMSPEARERYLEEFYNRKYGGGMSAAELQDFETLVGRLEGSKMRQAAQSNRARQRDVFAGGLASMMGNF